MIAFGPASFRDHPPTFTMLFLAVAVFIGGFALDTVARAEPVDFSSPHCIVSGVMAGQSTADVTTMPCTGKMQQHGWPIVTQIDYSERVSTNGGYLPSHYSQCRYGCAADLGLVAGVASVGVTAYVIMGNIILNRQLRMISGN